MTAKKFSRTWQLQAALAAGLFVFGAFAFWLEYKRAPRLEREEEEAKKALILGESGISEIQIKGSARVVLKCAATDPKKCLPSKDGSWKVVTALDGEVAADESNVTSLLSSLSTLVPQETIDLSGDSEEKKSRLLKEYGLEPAARADAYSVQITQSSGPQLRLSLGNVHPIGEGYFAVVESGNQWDGKKVLVLPAYFKTQFEKNLTYWRSKKMGAVESSQVVELQMEEPGPNSWKLVRKSDAAKTWELSSGKNSSSPADPDVAESLATGLGFLQAKDFLKSNSTPRGKFLRSVSWRLKGESEQNRNQIRYTQDGKRIYAKWMRTGQVFEVDPSQPQQFSKKRDELLLKKLLSSSERYSIQKISFKSIRSTEQALTLVKDGATWLLEGGRQEAQSQKIGTLLDQLAGNRITSRITGSKSGIGKERLELALFGPASPQGGEPSIERKIVFWKNGGKVFGMEPAVNPNEHWLLDALMLQQLPWDLKELEKSPQP